MKILIADDDATYLRIYAKILEKNFEPVTATNGNQALQALANDPLLRLALLDWEMPSMSGPEVCRHLREFSWGSSVYVVMATVRREMDDILEGFTAGANDYVTKPFHVGELLARVEVGKRMLELQASLARRVEDLEAALHRVNALETLLPICSYCKKIRNDDSSWEQVESYIARRTHTMFSHGICPECYREVMEEEMRAATNKR